MAEYIYPTKNYLTITQEYKSATHVGHDYGWNSSVAGGNNQPIVAIAGGKVITAVDGYGNTYPSQRIYGNYVIVQHSSGVYSLYGHLLKGIKVRKGQSVKQGDTLGYMGNSGYSNGQHLHFEFRLGGNSKSYAVNPITRLVCPQSVKISDRSLLRESIIVETAPTTKLYKCELKNLTNGDKDKVVALGKEISVEPSIDSRAVYNCTFSALSKGDRDKFINLANEIGVAPIITEV